jgi:hypothetical protein
VTLGFPKGLDMTRPIRRRVALAFVWFGIAGLTSLAIARPGLVTTHDGQTFEGDVVEVGDQVRIDRKGLSSTLNRRQIQSIDYATYAERFARDLAALQADDVAGRVTLARQAFDRGEYDLSMTAVGGALDIDPLDRDARRLHSVVQRQMTLTTGGAAATQAAAVPPRMTPPADAVQPVRKIAGLNEEQINIVRKNELRRDDRARIRFANNVRKRFVDQQGGMSFQQFATFSDAEQAIAILSRGTRDQTEDVRILSDPQSLQTFARRIHGPVVQGCATSLCHGGEHAGSFRLLSGVPDAATAITNFYLLATHSKPAPAAPDSIFGGGDLELISRGRSAESLLLQYALPRAKARLKHPVVRGWDGMVRSLDDRIARDIAQWIDFELNPFKPDYGFNYVLPTRAAATQATTEPVDLAPTSAPDADTDKDATSERAE